MKNVDMVNRKTVAEYINALTKIFIIEDLEAWHPKLRSRATISTSSTRHFVDPAIEAYFLNANCTDLLKDVETLGLLFESLVIRNLIIYAESIEVNIYHYRDHSGQKAYATIHFKGGSWGAIEVKLGNNFIDYGAKNLLKLTDKIGT